MYNIIKMCYTNDELIYEKKFKKNIVSSLIIKKIYIHL